jgi:hypothetical protein
VQFVTGAYQPILVLSGVVCLLGLVAWARDARADDPVVDHARRITHLRDHAVRARARDAWQSAGRVPAAAHRVAPAPAARIAGDLADVLGRAGRVANRAVAAAGASAGSGLESARPRVARATAGAIEAARIVSARARAEGRSLAGTAAAVAVSLAARASAALRSATAESAPDSARRARSHRRVAATEQVAGWLTSVRRPDASAIPFGPLSGVPAPVPTPERESQVERERRRLA